MRVDHLLVVSHRLDRTGVLFRLTFHLHPVAIFGLAMLGTHPESPISTWAIMVIRTDEAISFEQRRTARWVKKRL